MQLQHGSKLERGRVVKRAIGPDGTTSGEYNENPILNSVVYEVEFPDGDVQEYAANVIAENMLSQVDSDGYSLSLIQGIVDHRSNSSAVPKSEKYIITQSGQRRLRQTTVGWKLLVAWRDGSETWVPLKDIKESNPVDVAEYAKASDIDDEAAFAWWVPYTLRKRDIIISSVKRFTTIG